MIEDKPPKVILFSLDFALPLLRPFYHDLSQIQFHLDLGYESP